MELKVKTEDLGKLVSKAQKVAKANPHIDLTTYVEIEADGKVLSVSGYDGMNYYKFKSEVETQVAKFVFRAESFFKLFSKTTSKEVLLKDEGTHILFSGNGSYKLDKEIDKSTDEAISIKFPEIVIKKKTKIKTAEFAKVTARVLSGVSEEQAPIHLTGILGREDKFLATDPNRSVMVEANLIKEKVLFSVEFTKIVALFDSAEFSFGTVETDGIKYYLAESEGGYVVGSQVLGVEEFPADAIDDIFKQPVEATAVVDKSALLSVIERFTIFADRIGEQGVEIAVTKDGLILRKENIGEEIIPLKDMNNFKPYQCRTDILRLKKLIDNADTSELTFMFGNPSFVIFKYDNTKLLLSTAQEN